MPRHEPEVDQAKQIAIGSEIGFALEKLNLGDGAQVLGAIFGQMINQARRSGGPNMAATLAGLFAQAVERARK